MALGVGGCGDLACGVVGKQVGAAVGLGAGSAAVAQVVTGSFAFEDFAVFVEVGNGLKAVAEFEKPAFSRLPVK